MEQSNNSKQSKFLFGNWKMALDINESIALANTLLELAPKSLKQTLVGVAPSYLAIPEVINILKRSYFQVGAQNVSYETKGAYTGEVSARCVKNIKAGFSIVGHSERRNNFGETNDSAANRAIAATEHDLSVVFCVGETAQHRQDGLTNIILEAQLKPLIEKLSANKWDKVTIAYEPMWSIGTGKIPSAEQIDDTHSFIKKHLSEKNCGNINVIYGGSATPDNFTEIISIPSVDGGLPGGASLKAESFIRLLEICENS